MLYTHGTVNYYHQIHMTTIPFNQTKRDTLVNLFDAMRTHLHIDVDNALIIANRIDHTFQAQLLAHDILAALPDNPLRKILFTGRRSFVSERLMTDQLDLIRLPEGSEIMHPYTLHVVAPIIEVITFAQTTRLNGAGRHSGVVHNSPFDFYRVVINSYTENELGPDHPLLQGFVNVGSVNVDWADSNDILLRATITVYKRS